MPGHGEMWAGSVERTVNSQREWSLLSVEKGEEVKK